MNDQVIVECMRVQDVVPAPAAVAASGEDGDNMMEGTANDHPADEEEGMADDPWWTMRMLIFGRTTMTMQRRLPVRSQ